MKLKDKDIQTIKKILKKHDVSRAELFGSYARGDATKKSDVDLLVKLKVGKSLLDLIGLENKLKNTLGLPFDLVTYASIHPLIQPYIEKDKVSII